ncbi:MAG: glycosyltransferase, partial [Gemmatimonadota bacterium]
DPQKLSVVSNTPPRARAANTAHRAPSPGTCTVAYLGLLEVARGIGEMIDAMGILRAEHGSAFRAIVIGGGRDADLFTARARAAGLLDTTITFLGLLPHDDALAAINAADIGIIPHHATELWNSTIPNKLFDYMAAGLPVISSDTIPCARIIRETRCGEIFHSGDARSMADAIVRVSAPSELSRMSAAGMSAVRERYNWEHDTATLLSSIQTFAARK